MPRASVAALLLAGAALIAMGAVAANLNGATTKPSAESATAPTTGETPAVSSGGGADDSTAEDAVVAANRLLGFQVQDNPEPERRFGWWPLLIAGAVLGGAVVVIHRLTGSTSTAATVDDRESVSKQKPVSSRHVLPEPDTFPNEIHRAWWAMVQRVDGIDPRRAGPTELADRLIQQGFPAEPITELTRLFEVVRYGETPVSPARERHATELLDRIRTQGGDDESES